MSAHRTAPEQRVKKAELTAEHLRTLVYYDPATGVMNRIKKTCNRVAPGKVCGALNTKGYLQVSVENRLYLLTNLAVLYMTGAWPLSVVDHRNGQKTDNRWDNLRDVSLSVNAQNQKLAHRTNKSGYLGVSPLHGKWAANIDVNKKRTHLGSFDTPELASAAYQIFMPREFKAPQAFSKNKPLDIAMTAVSSSQIKAIGYSEEHQTLAVQFNHGAGALYQYPNVSKEAHAAFVGAESMGKHFGQHIQSLPFEKFPAEPVAA